MWYGRLKGGNQQGQKKVLFYSLEQSPIDRARARLFEEQALLILLFFFLYFLAGAGGALTLLESQARPSRRPSPVVAQLGTTYQTLSLSLESCRASVTSWGFMAAMSC